MHPRIAALLLLLLLSPAQAADEKPGPLSAWQLRALVARKPTGKDLDRLVQHFHASFGKKELETGTAKPRIQDTLACWALVMPAGAGAAAEPKPRVFQLDGQKSWDLIPVAAGSPLHVAFADLPRITDFRYAYEWNGKLTGAGALRIEHIPPTLESFPLPGAPQGKITRFPWKSKILADTTREYSVYVPAQYDPKDPPACVMVFQDGDGYLKGAFNTPTVLDNLIYRKELPVIIGIFINPGVIPQQGKPAISKRSEEYDTLSNAYARFLVEEILPEVAKNYNLSKDPNDRAICGISSGGICAFTVAWEMPDQFGKVLSHVGSFTNIRGGHVYPALIRKTPKKNIRVYLQANERDLDNEHGSWPLANQTMAAALKFKGYDYGFDMGPGFHSGKYGGAHLPEELRWLWRDHPRVKGE